MAEIGISAVGTAIFAGAISLLGLIVSKEQKTSEFRQKWIDDLRAEFVSYITAVNSLVDTRFQDWKDDESRNTALASFLQKINAASFNISLRLNSEERGAQKILQYMQSIGGLISNLDGISSDSLRSLEQLFLTESKILLKQEWRRVKEGEPSFSITKWALIVGLALSPLALIFYRL